MSTQSPNSPLKKTFLHLAGGNTLASASQALQFFVLARCLGPFEFGKFAAANAFVSVLVPFSGMGFANVLVMRASRDAARLTTGLGNAFFVMATTAALLTTGAVIWGPHIVGAEVSALLMLLCCTNEVIVSKIMDICWHAHLASDRPQYSTKYMLTQSLARTVAVGIWAASGWTATAVGWATCSLVVTCFTSLSALVETLRTTGNPRLTMKEIWGEFGVGTAFAVGLSAKSFYTDADKVFLARFAGNEIVAQYTVAYRIIQLASIPIRALSAALQNSLFRSGASGVSGSLKVTARVAGPTILGMLGFGALVWLFAPLLTLVAGDAYATAVEMLRGLWLLPLFLAVQSLLGDALAASGYHTFATVGRTAAAGFICLCCWYAIPLWGWKGALGAVYLSQVFLTILLAGAALHGRHHSRAVP